eukprot:1187716-Prorocentrum_minimum.AAC.1
MVCFDSRARPLLLLTPSDRERFPHAGFADAIGGGGDVLHRSGHGEVPLRSGRQQREVRPKGSFRCTTLKP